MKLLGRIGTGDGDMFYGLITSTSDPDYAVELIAMIKYDGDHPFSETVPGITVIGLPRTNFRTRADRMEFNCKDQKIKNPRWEYYNSKLSRLSAMALLNPNAITPVRGSPYEKLMGTSNNERFSA